MLDSLQSTLINPNPALFGGTKFIFFEKKRFARNRTRYSCQLL